MQRVMRKIVLLLFAFVSITSFAKSDLSDKYVMRLRANDLLYFILPNEIESVDKNKSLKFDITYATSEQDVTINMSIFTKQELIIDSIGLASNKNLLIKDFKIFYIEKEGNWWCHRISCRVPFDYLKQMYLSTNSYKIEIYDKQKVLTYTFSGKTWKNEQLWMNKLLALITQNITNKR